MTTNRPLRVFLCHSSADKPAVRELYKKLRVEPWIQPWLDEEELHPGQTWEDEIEKAVESSDVVLVCLSNNSIHKKGYVQRELRFALDIALEVPEGEVFIIPLRLEECTPPRSLRDWQYADYFESQRERGLERLLISLRKRADSLKKREETESKLEGENSKEYKTEADTIVSEGLESTPYEELATKTEDEENKVETPSLESVSAIEKIKPDITENKIVVEIQDPEFLPHPTQEWIEVNKITLSNGMEFMRVPAGKFLIGSDELSWPYSIPEHDAHIPYDYWMGRYLVTVDQYAKYLEDIGQLNKRIISEQQKEKDLPIRALNWKQAASYCAWLNNLLHKEVGSSLSFRLPGDEEWEKAARGTDGRRYPWGNMFDANYCRSNDSFIQITPVGFYSPRSDSPFGCADMVGNIWQWTSSPYSYLGSVSPTSEEANNYSLRGSWGSGYEGDALCFRRYPSNSYHPESYYIGFRICLGPFLG